MLGSMVYTSFACALRVNAAWRTRSPAFDPASPVEKFKMLNVQYRFDSRGIGSRIYSTIDSSCTYDARFYSLFCGGGNTFHPHLSRQAIDSQAKF